MPRYLDTRRTQQLGPTQYIRNSQGIKGGVIKRFPIPIQPPYARPVSGPANLISTLKRFIPSR